MAAEQSEEWLAVMAVALHEGEELEKKRARHRRMRQAMVQPLERLRDEMSVALTSALRDPTSDLESLGQRIEEIKQNADRAAALKRDIESDVRQLNTMAESLVAQLLERTTGPASPARLVPPPVPAGGVSDQATDNRPPSPARPPVPHPAPARGVSHQATDNRPPSPARPVHPPVPAGGVSDQPTDNTAPAAGGQAPFSEKVANLKKTLGTLEGCGQAAEELRAWVADIEAAEQRLEEQRWTLGMLRGEGRAEGELGALVVDAESAELQLQELGWLAARQADSAAAELGCDLKCAAALRQLFDKAAAFVTTTWPSDREALLEYTVQENTALQTVCPALEKFLKGARHLHGCATDAEAFDAILEECFFAWHSTGTDEAFQAICLDGWDPKLRRVQAFGRGEYHAHSVKTSLDAYARGTGRVILSCLLPGPHLDNNAHYVVDNPLDGSCCFNLPVLVVTVNNGAALQIKEGPKKPTLYASDLDRLRNIATEAALLCPTPCTDAAAGPPLPPACPDAAAAPPLPPG